MATYQAVISDDGREFIVIDEYLNQVGQIRPGSPPATKTWCWQVGVVVGQEDDFRRAVEAVEQQHRAGR